MVCRVSTVVLTGEEFYDVACCRPDRGEIKLYPMILKRVIFKFQILEIIND